MAGERIVIYDLYYGIICVMDTIEKILKEILREEFGADVLEEGEVEISVPPELSGEFRADYATNIAMKLSKKLKRNPREIAEVIREKFLEKSKIKVEVAGPGFLNFMLPDEYFIKKIEDFSRNEADFLENISQDEYEDKVVVVEFSDPNPFKVLHIGHLYTSVIGDAMSRMVEFSGGKVHRVNFGGDVGLHVAKTLYALMKNKDSLEEFKRSEEAEVIANILARAYVEGTRAYEESEEAKGEIVKLNKQIYEIAEKKIREGELAEVYFRGREASYRYFDEFYEKIGVKFEKYYPESEVAERGVEEVEKHTPEVYQESEGAIVFKGEEFGLHTRVFMNKEGLPTYETKDVGLLFTKNDDFKFDESVVITGNDIVEYMKVVLKSVEQYAPELVRKTKHITHGMVKLPGAVKMASRKGNFVKAVDVIRSVEERLEDLGLALGAIKYSFLKYRVGGDIEFDIDESVSLNGNSGPYLLYSAVRAKKILAAETDSSKAQSAEPWALSMAEVKVCKKIVEYGEVLGEATREMAPHLLCSYLFELAKEFSRFYESCRVRGSEREKERLKIVLAFQRVMEHGLGILGINVPEEM